MATPERERVSALIRAAFAPVERPGNWALRGSLEGTEPALVEEAFGDKPDWQSLDAAFLDEAPAGFGSALSFLSDEAFRYFLPAYLLADLAGRLERADPVFHLCHGVGGPQRDRPLNPRRYGARTWLDAMQHRLSTFRPPEVEAIVAYLRYKETDAERPTAELIAAALRDYWLPRLARGAPA
jgi:hypothetical protein